MKTEYNQNIDKMADEIQSLEKVHACDTCKSTCTLVQCIIYYCATCTLCMCVCGTIYTTI